MELLTPGLSTCGPRSALIRGRISTRAATKGHILLIKLPRKRRNFYDVRDLTIICHQSEAVLKQIALTGCNE